MRRGGSRGSHHLGHARAPTARPRHAHRFAAARIQRRHPGGRPRPCDRDGPRENGRESQRAVRLHGGRGGCNGAPWHGRRAAVEILLNTPLIAENILKGQFHNLKEIMTKSRELGMQTFDQALFDLYNEGAISYDEALRNADSLNELRLQIKLKSTRQEGVPASAATSLNMVKEGEQEEA